MASGLKPVLGLALICLSLLAVAEATDFLVGDSQGWTFNVQNWPNGKSFKAGPAGDGLVFKYPKGAHNVVVVDAAGYNSCKPGPGSKVLDSGNDRVTLPEGDTYFLCSFPGHCERGMKIAVKAVRA